MQFQKKPTGVYATIKPAAFWQVLLYFMIGGVFNYLHLVYFYIPCYLIGFACLLYIFFHNWIFYYPARHEAEAQKFMQYRLLSVEQRYELGYTKAPESVTTRHITPENKNSGFNQKNKGLPVSPPKLLIFSRGVLSGAKSLAFLEWTPISKGKLFSDGEYEKFINAMVEQEYAIKTGTHTNADRELTVLGVVMLYDFIMDSGQPIRDIHDEVASKYHAALVEYGRMAPDPESELDNDLEPTPAVEESFVVDAEPIVD